MALKVSGKNVDIGQALRSRVESAVSGTHGTSQSIVMACRATNHGGLRLVYHRKDGHVGWVEPALIEGGHA